MKLLLDENLSDRIVTQLADLYPDSAHVKTLALIQSEDALIWEYAKVNDFAIISKDSDFHQRHTNFAGQFRHHQPVWRQ